MQSEEVYTGGSYNESGITTKSGFLAVGVALGLFLACGLGFVFVQASKGKRTGPAAVYEDRDYYHVKCDQCGREFTISKEHPATVVRPCPSCYERSPIWFMVYHYNKAHGLPERHDLPPVEE